MNKPTKSVSFASDRDRDKRQVFFLIGLCTALGMVLLAFEWKVGGSLSDYQPPEPPAAETFTVQLVHSEPPKFQPVNLPEPTAKAPVSFRAKPSSTPPPLTASPSATPSPCPRTTTASCSRGKVEGPPQKYGGVGEVRGVRGDPSPST